MVQCNRREHSEAAMASAKFLRRQAERCAELAGRTNDDDSRQRYEQLQRKYCYLADLEEQTTAEPSSDNRHKPAA